MSIGFGKIFYFLVKLKIGLFQIENWYYLKSFNLQFGIKNFLKPIDFYFLLCYSTVTNAEPKQNKRKGAFKHE